MIGRGVELRIYGSSGSQAAAALVVAREPEKRAHSRDDILRLGLLYHAPHRHAVPPLTRRYRRRGRRDSSHANMKGQPERVQYGLTCASVNASLRPSRHGDWSLSTREARRRAACRSVARNPACVSNSEGIPIRIACSELGAHLSMPSHPTTKWRHTHRGGRPQTTRGYRRSNLLSRALRVAAAGHCGTHFHSRPYCGRNTALGQRAQYGGL
ncbi:hypothetical protein C8Q77DRAFT_137678 [Trametes polyzona]|nr:hypothetical protein C8Q77DRAFT_137678 [Trametes polyzona]